MGRVLLVDDDELLLDALRRGLVREAKIDTSTTALEATHLATKNKYAVVVTDLVMSGMNGLELVETLRVISPETVCVVLTGRLEHAYPKGLPENVHAYLTKPCGIVDVVGAIHSALSEYVLRCHRDSVLR